jgi:hypothetical protein
MDVRGITYNEVQTSKRIPIVTALLSGHPKCANASTTGAGFMNLMTASKIKKTAANPLRIRPDQTPFLDEEVPTADCAISEVWPADDILPPFLY